MSDAFLLRIFVQGRAEPLLNVWSREEVLQMIRAVKPEHMHRAFGVLELPIERVVADPHVLRAAAMSALSDRLLEYADDFFVSWLGDTATSVRISRIDRMELIDLDVALAGVAEKDRAPYKSSGVGFRMVGTEEAT